MIHFYTNGVIDRKFKDGDEIPSDFHRGRTNGCHGSTFNTRWATDGNTDILLQPNEPLPAGFHYGKKHFTAEHKQKISNALKQYEKTPEHCKHLSESHLTETYRQNIQNTLLKRYGVVNSFQADFVKAQCNTPEVVQKRLEQ